MKPGTLILVNRTGPGCYGAEGKVCVVTDEVNDHGLRSMAPGYNVAVLGRGQIWRIPEDSEVKILYCPHN